MSTPPEQPTTTTGTAHGMKTCPRCAEEIHEEAVVCRFCGARFEVHTEGYCPTDHTMVKTTGEAAACPTCGNELVDLHVVSTLIDERAEAAAAAGTQVNVAGEMQRPIVRHRGRDRGETSGRLFGVRIPGFVSEVELQVNEDDMLLVHGRRVQPQVRRIYSWSIWSGLGVGIAVMLFAAGMESEAGMTIGAWLLLLVAVAGLVGAIYMRAARVEDVDIAVPLEDVHNVRRTYNWPLIVLLFFVLSPLISIIYAAVAGQRYLRIQAPFEEDGVPRRHRLRLSSSDMALNLERELGGW